MSKATDTKAETEVQLENDPELLQILLPLADDSVEFIEPAPRRSCQVEAAEAAPEDGQGQEPTTPKRGSSETSYHRYNKKAYKMYPDKFPLASRAVLSMVEKSVRESMVEMELEKEMDKDRMAAQRVSVEYAESGWDPELGQAWEWKKQGDLSLSRVLQEEKTLAPLDDLLQAFRARPHDILPGEAEPDWDAIAGGAGVLRLIRDAATVGTCVLLHPDDVQLPGVKMPLSNLVVTARELVVASGTVTGTGTGTVQDTAMEVNLGSVKHVASWQDAAVSFLRIQDIHTVHYPRFDVHGGPQALRFPATQLLDSFTPGQPVFLLAYPGLLDRPPWKSSNHPMDRPALLSGVISYILHPDLAILADYKCFPGTTGGAVLSEAGELVGIHLRSLNTLETDMEAVLMATFNQTTPDTITLLKEGKFKCAANRLERLADANAAYAASNVQHKAQLGLFVPWTTVKAKLLLSHKHLRSVPAVGSVTE